MMFSMRSNSAFKRGLLVKSREENRSYKNNLICAANLGSGPPIVVELFNSRRTRRKSYSTLSINVTLPTTLGFRRSSAATHTQIQRGLTLAVLSVSRTSRLRHDASCSAISRQMILLLQQQQ